MLTPPNASDAGAFYQRECPLNLGVLAFSPLAKGVLTGKYHGEGKPNGGRMTNEGMKDFLPEEQRAAPIISAVQSVSEQTGRSIITAGTSTYLYDANGRRVRKTVAGTSIDFLYDLSGRQISEISSTGVWNRSEIYAGSRHLATYSSGTTYFTQSAWLGTERVRTNVSGGVYETCNSLAFGDWLTCSAGDPSPMHFTGNERDSESGLDNFKARFFGSSMGSFTGPDPVVLSRQKVRDPQQWNSYAYVRNNPLRYRDPTGMYLCMDSKKCDSEQDKAFEYARKRDLKSNRT